jgi:hypothetical protein
MNKQILAEQILKNFKPVIYEYDGDGKGEAYTYSDAIAAIVEAMDAPAKEGMKWVKASERLPESGKQVFWNRHEEPPAFGKYSQCGNSHDLVTIDSSGEEEAEPINYDWEWLDESAPAKEVEAANTQIVEWDSLRGMFNKVATSEHVIGYLEQNGYYLVKKLAKEVEAISDSEGNGIELIAAERNRQISKEGWTTTHDDEHKWGELAIAASCYALNHTDASVNNLHTTNLDGWPWDRMWWKPKSPIKDLVRAGALICAEIDRMLRNEQNDERIATQQTMPQGTKAGIKEAAKEAISVPAQKGVSWIGIRDKLPGIGSKVIGYRPYAHTHGDDTITILKYEGEHNIDLNGHSHGFERSHCVSHWMPLPEPPAAQPLLPSLEEKKEDLVVSDNNSSSTSGDAPFLKQ